MLQCLRYGQLDPESVPRILQTAIEMHNCTTVEEHSIRLFSSDDEASGKLYTLPMLADILDIPASTLRRWQRRGLLVPTRQINRLAYFNFDQLINAKHLAKLIVLDGRPSLSIEAKISRLSQNMPAAERLSDIDLVIDGRTVLVREEHNLRDPQGQLHIDFYSDDSAHPQLMAEVISFPSNVAIANDLSPQTVDQFLKVALCHEDNNDLSAAIDSYRQMMLTFGPSPDTCFAIAELLYGLGDLTAARERYYSAIELDPTFVEAYANLGCLLMELQDWLQARTAFEAALRHHANYPDAHFHLAKSLDHLQESVVAEYHWKRFLELAPNTPWAEEARARLALETPTLF